MRGMDGIPRGMGVRVQGLRFRVQGSRFKVQGSRKLGMRNEGGGFAAFLEDGILVS